MPKARQPSVDRMPFDSTRTCPPSPPVPPARPICNEKPFSESELATKSVPALPPPPPTLWAKIAIAVSPSVEMLPVWLTSTSPLSPPGPVEPPMAMFTADALVWLSLTL